jgi:hypothetical protein
MLRLLLARPRSEHISGRAVFDLLGFARALVCVRLWGHENGTDEADVRRRDLVARRFWAAVRERIAERDALRIFPSETEAMICQSSSIARPDAVGYRRCRADGPFRRYRIDHRSGDCLAPTACLKASTSVGRKGRLIGTRVRRNWMSGV